MIGEDKMYVVVNKDLKMSRGKMAAQVAHAVARLEMGVPKKVIILEGSTEQLHNLDAYVENTDYCRALYIDEGVNEVPAMSVTAIAIGMVDELDRPDFLEGFPLVDDPKWLKRLYL